MIGVLLVAFASASLLHSLGVLHGLGNAVGAVAIVATMLGLLFGPWFVRLGRSLASERAARIREQERAATSKRARAALKRAVAQLPDEDRLIVELLSKGAKVPEIAAGLRCEAKPLYARRKKILNTLREAMEREGVHADDIRDILGGE